MPSESQDGNEAKLARILHHLEKANSILFVTGAGISAESGLPTYRGIGGLYDEAATPDGIPIEEALSGAMLQRNPALTWKYIHQIEASCRGATFNNAHRVLAEMESRFERVWVLTQNVDGFHKAAGSKNVIDIHGDVHDLLCTECDYRITVEDYRDVEPCPRCPDCGALVRPNVVLFGEMLPAEKMLPLRQELRKGFDLVFSIGTSSLFPYIMQPVIEAKHMGKPTVEINPGETPLSTEVDVKLSMGAAEACQAIWDRLTSSLET